MHDHRRIAMLDTDTGELIEKTLEHGDGRVQNFYYALPGPVLVGIEASGSMQWFLELTEELGIECRVGHPAKIRQAETRKQSTIGGMRVCFWSCWQRIVSQRSRCHLTFSELIARDFHKSARPS